MNKFETLTNEVIAIATKLVDCNYNPLSIDTDEIKELTEWLNTIATTKFKDIERKAKNRICP